MWVDELDRLVHEHLTAASLMVAIADPVPREMRALEARRYLRDRDFDLTLVGVDRLEIVTRKKLESLKSRADLAKPIKDLVESPRRTRLVERTLPIRDVVGKLRSDASPLLVVGDAGVTHIITVADFAGVAGTAVVLSYVLAVDRGLNQLLHGRAEEALKAVTEKQRAEAEERQRWAAEEGAALDLIDYLSMAARFRAVRQLGLDETYELGKKDEHALLVKTRNAAAHAGLGDPASALEAVTTAESMLEQVTNALTAELAD